MGVHVADVDGDGDNDLLVMNLDTESDSFFRNEGTLLRRRDQQRRPARGQPPLHALRRWRCSTSTTTAGSISTRPTAASACRARPSPPTRTPSRACCCAASTGRRFEEVQPRGGTASPLVAHQPRRRLRRPRQRRRPRHRSSPTATRRRTLLHNVAPSRGHWLLVSRARRQRPRRAWCRGDDAAPAARTRAPRRAHRPTATWPPTTRACTWASARPRASRPWTSAGSTASTERFGPFDADRIVTITTDGTGDRADDRRPTPDATSRNEAA